MPHTWSKETQEKVKEALGEAVKPNPIGYLVKCKQALELIRKEEENDKR